MYELEKVLDHLQLPFASFVDLCIMAGCDYNENIPGIAIIRSFRLIKEYQRIENVLLNTKKDGGILDYETCRRLFDNTQKMLIPPRLELEIAMELGKIDDETSRFLQRFSLDGWVPKLMDFYERIESYPRPFQFVII